MGTVPRCVLITRTSLFGWRFAVLWLGFREFSLFLPGWLSFFLVVQKWKKPPNYWFQLTPVTPVVLAGFLGGAAEPKHVRRLFVMSKLGCKCGHVISNFAYPSSTEGTISRQQDEQALDSASEHAADFCAAVAAGRRDEWIKNYFPSPYPASTSDSGVLYDIIQSRLQPMQLSVCECSNCGRLWVQETPGQNRYISFTPDVQGYHAVLKLNAEGE